MKKKTARVWKLFWVLVLTPVLLIALMQTPPGKTVLAAGLSKALSRSEHYQVWIGEISGWIPGKVEIADLAVADANGVWLEAKGLHCRWMIRELVDRRIRLRKLGAQEIILYRLPVVETSERAGKVAVPEFQHVEIHLDGLQVERLALSKEVVGVPLEYSVHSGGAAWLPLGRFSGELVVDGDATGRVGFDGRDGRLTLTPHLENMVKPSFGLDRLSGQSKIVISGDGIEGVVSATLEKGAWQGHLHTRMQFAGRQLQLQSFEFDDSTYSAAGDLSLSFSEGKIGVTLDASLMDFEVGGTATVATSQASWAVDVQTLNLRGWDGVAMALSGTVDPKHVALSGALEEFDVRQLPRAGISNFSGRVNGQISVLGSLASPRIVAGLEVVGFASALDELPGLDFRVVGGVADGLLFGETSLTNRAAGYFNASLSMPCAFSIVPFSFRPEPAKLGGHLDANLDLDLFNRLAFFGSQNVEGLLVAELAYEDREPSGFLRLERGRYEHFDWGVVSRDLELELVAVAGGFKVERGSATDGQGGSVSLSGGLGGEGPALELVLSEAKVLRREEVDAQVSGRLEISGRYARPTVAGRLVIDRADILLDNISPPPPLLLTDYEEGIASESMPVHSGGTHRRLPFGLDVLVDMPDQIFVNASLIDSVWGGGVRLVDTPQGISVEGKIEPRRGYVSFIGKKFRFTEGAILFDGLVPTVTVMDGLTAEYSRSDVTARLILNGRVNDPHFRLESTPAMPEDEILSHVLFNRDTRSISPYQAFQIASAAHQLSGGMNGPGFMYGVRQAVGVDTLEWRDADAIDGSSSVAAGKYITPSLYVEVDQPLDSKGEAGMMAEYEVTRHFSVETSTGPQMRPGIGVNWKTDY